MFAIELNPELEARLDRLASETGQSKSYYAELAIKEFLEDREDYLKGIAALEGGAAKPIRSITEPAIRRMRFEEEEDPEGPEK